MSKLIGIFIIAVVCWGGYLLFRQWERIKNDEDAQKQQAAALAIQGETLPGLPYHLAESLRSAQLRGPAALRDWIKRYGSQVQDPRKAWLEMEYCMAIFRHNPEEARRVFKSVKDRLPTDSELWPRVRQLENSLE